LGNISGYLPPHQRQRGKGKGIRRIKAGIKAPGRGLFNRVEPRTTRVLVQIQRATHPLEAKRKTNLPLLSPFLLWRAKKATSRNWLGNHCYGTGEVLPFPDKEFLTQYMRSGKELLNPKLYQKSRRRPYLSLKLPM